MKPLEDIRAFFNGLIHKEDCGTRVAWGELEIREGVDGSTIPTSGCLGGQGWGKF